jgi:multidrug efflux pump subunit AcrA (membrane-fusion protein)
MKNYRMKQAGKWALIITGLLILCGITACANKPKETVFNVSEIKLAKQKVPHVLIVQGVLEGDPQVKVYPQVSGKFAKNAVAEGASVNKDDVVAYIDRDQIGYKYALAPVKAPVSGIVTKLYYIDRGDQAGPQMPVAEIANEDNVKVVFNLGQDDLLAVQKGQKAQIFFAEDQAFYLDGVVNSVPPVIDTDIMAGTVVVTAPNKARTMKIGMSVNVEILTEEKDSYMVPEQAVLPGADGVYIYEDKAGKAAAVKVTTGYSHEGQVEINGPLADGDEVVTEGNSVLSDGAKLSVTTAAIPAAAPAPVEKAADAAPVPVKTAR